MSVLAPGAQRARSLHLHKTAHFRRNLQIRVGRFAVTGLTTGSVPGLAMTRYAKGQSLTTAGHGLGGSVALAVFLVRAATGWWLERKPGKRFWLPALDGLASTAGVGLALNQARSGLDLYRTFLAGL